MDLNIDKITEISRKKKGKRKLANLEACKLELKNELNDLFKIFEQSVEMTNTELRKHPVVSRCRGFEASLLQTNFAELLFFNFPGNAFFGRNKRLTLRIKGYVFFFKKLNNKGLPMNVMTQSVNRINNQIIDVNLFFDTDYNEAPILYFGYQKNKIGQYVNPQIVYIDEDKISFSIEASTIGYLPNLFSEPNGIEKGEVKVKIKKGRIAK
ncbi:MAG: hypothetical protein ACN6O7_09080 [Sphingobacterium sp.]